MTKQVQVLVQKQSLNLTASMRKSLSILQMSSIELQKVALDELEKNPFVEDSNVLVGEEESTNKSLYDKGRVIGSYSNYSSSKSNDYNFLLNISTKKNLKDYIMEQINLVFNDNKLKLIAFYLLDSLQSNGYLNIDLSEVAKNLKCPKHIVEKVLKKLHNFEPSGVFARSLVECLLIQLKEKNLINKSFIKLVNNMDLIANGEIAKLIKLCNVDKDYLMFMIKQVRLLNPKPGNNFIFEETSYKIPDVILTLDKDKTIILEINSDAIPRLRVNEDYYTKVQRELVCEADKKFTKGEIEAAKNIVNSITNRANTILKVATAIVQEQIHFFTGGIMNLKPLTLNKIAAITGFNESTISRSTSAKYISTPLGIYELKYFFSSGLTSCRCNETSISSTKARELIKQIIFNENPNRVFSDEEVSLELSKFNISIARRTVAKYRQSMGIDVSSIRKKRYKMENIYV